MAVIAAIGNKSVKKVNSRAVEVTPWCGAGGTGEYPTYGVGFITQEGTYFWGFCIPQRPINSWKAMKLLELLPEINQDTLSACWYAVQSENSSDEKKYVDRLAAMFANKGKFGEIIQRVLDLYPSDAEITEMLTNLKGGGVEVDSEELTELVAQGLIKPNPLIDDLVQLEQKKEKEHAEWEASLLIPVPEPESLGQLFTELGISDLIEDTGEGWIDINREQLDELVKKVSTGRYRWSLQLYRKVAEREIQHPVLKTPEGTSYTLLTAVFRDEAIFVEVTVEKENVDPITEEYKVSQLRTFGFGSNWV